MPLATNPCNIVPWVTVSKSKGWPASHPLLYYAISNLSFLKKIV